jgi:hypothetical protein
MHPQIPALRFSRHLKILFNERAPSCLSARIKFLSDEIVLRLLSRGAQFFPGSPARNFKFRDTVSAARHFAHAERDCVSAAVASWQHQAKKHREFRFVPLRFRLIQAQRRRGD